MQDCTQVVELLSKSAKKSDEASKLSTEAYELKKKAQSLCTHPAVSKKTEEREDEYGKILGYDHTYTCVICGKILEENDAN